MLLTHKYLFDSECDLAMCEDCDSLMHKPRKFKLHKRSRVPEEKSQASNTGDKKADPEVIKNNKIEAVVCMDDDEVDGGEQDMKNE